MKIKYLFLHVTYAHTKYFGVLVSPATPTPCLEHYLTSIVHCFKHEAIQDPQCCPTPSHGLGLRNKYLLFTECRRQFSISRNKI